MYSEDDPLAEPNLLFEQVENSRFKLVSPKGGTESELICSSHGVAAGDINGDGGMDVVVVNSNNAVHILKNVLQTSGDWIVFQVLNSFGSDALGAKIHLLLEDGSSLFGEVATAKGYASAHDPKVHFGVGNQKVMEATVTWPNGLVQTLKNPELRRIHTVEYAE